MKLKIAEALTELVNKYNEARWKEDASIPVLLLNIKKELHEVLAYQYHHLTPDAEFHLQKTLSAETVEYALTSITAISAALTAAHVNDSITGHRTLKGAPLDNASVQYVNLANASRPHYPVLCQQVQALQRTSFDIHDGSIFNGDPEGEYVKLDDVLRVLGGVAE